MRKAVAFAALLALAMPAFAADRFAGTWKLNPQKSSGANVAAEGLLVATDQGENQNVAVTGKGKDGKPWSLKFTVPMKGGDGKVTEGAPWNGVRAQPFTATARDLTFMTDGKPALHVHSVLSRDGKTMTSTHERFDEAGKPARSVDVWERQ